MESYKKTGAVVEHEKHEDVGGRKFDVEIEEFELNLLNDFRSALKNVDNFKCPLNDSFLLRFLRTKKHNVAHAVKVHIIQSADTVAAKTKYYYLTVTKYFGLRKKYPEMLRIPFTTIEKVLKTNFLRVLTNRDQNGSIIVYFKFVQWNPKVFTFDEIMMAVYYIAEEITTIKEVQEEGIVAIIDFAGLTVSHAAEIAKEVSMQQFRKIVNFYQEAFPAKFKKVIVVNLPLILTAIYAVGKYLIKYKLRNRIHPSSLGPEFIHDHISPNLLPVDLGGTLTNEQAFDKSFIDSAIKNEPYYRALEKCGYSM